MDFYLTGSVEKLRKQTLYIEEEDLAKLVKAIRQSDLLLGKNVGVISFNETVMKELLDITVISTDFDKMGRTAAQLVLGNKTEQFRNPFKVLLRGSYSDAVTMKDIHKVYDPTQEPSSSVSTC